MAIEVEGAERGRQVTKDEAIYGRRPILETLRAQRRIVHRLQIAEGASRQGSLANAIDTAEKHGIPIDRVDRHELERVSHHHQGIVALVSPYPYATLDDILEISEVRRESSFVLLLDLLQDPQNLGSLLRTADAVGVHGILIGKHRAVGVTPSVVASSAGACEHLLIARGNLAQGITRLKERGAWLAGLEHHPEAEPSDRVDLGGPLGLVVGSEGSGLRRLVRDKCDFLVQIPMLGKIESLNAAVAGSIALFQACSARNEAAKRLNAGADSVVH